MCASAGAGIQVNTRKHTQEHTRTFEHTCTHIHMCTRSHICIHTNTSVCMHTRCMGAFPATSTEAFPDFFLEGGRRHALSPEGRSQENLFVLVLGLLAPDACGLILLPPSQT